MIRRNSGIGFLMIATLWLSGCGYRVAVYKSGSGGNWVNKAEKPSVLSDRIVPGKVERSPSLPQMICMEAAPAGMVPPRRTTLHWLSSDSLNPVEFKGAEAKRKVAKAQSLLRKAENMERGAKEKHGLKFWLLMLGGAILLSLFVPLLSFTVSVILAICAAKLFRRGNYYRRKAAKLVRRAPGSRMSPRFDATNLLLALYILRHYLPAFQLKRKLERIRLAIYTEGEDSILRKFHVLEQLADSRTKTEQTRAALRTIKTVLIVFLAGSLVVLGISKAEWGPGWSW